MVLHDEFESTCNNVNFSIPGSCQYCGESVRQLRHLDCGPALWGESGRRKADRKSRGNGVHRSEAGQGWYSQHSVWWAVFLSLVFLFCFLNLFDAVQYSLTLLYFCRELTCFAENQNPLFSVTASLFCIRPSFSLWCWSKKSPDSSQTMKWSCACW